MKTLTGKALLEAMLEMPTGRPIKSSPKPVKATREVEVKGDAATVSLNLATTDPELIETEARKSLISQGLDPAQWEVTRFRTSEWTMANGDTGTSARYSFTRKPDLATVEPLDLEELIALTTAQNTGKPDALEGEPWGFIVGAGDMQWGKIDGDGTEGAVSRTIAGLNNAAEFYDFLKQFINVDPVHIAWEGDHGEGFVSQGGMNAWRTQLAQMEQDRLTRRSMLHAVQLFAPRTSSLSNSAVPGNHGEAVRFGKGGVTRYDDSHDTEAMIAVSDACALNPQAFGHVKFYVPDSDELTVTHEIAGSVIVHAHGHKWRHGQHFKWWEGQVFGGTLPAEAGILMAGHGHKFMTDTQGHRSFIQVPSLESESTWWRHLTGMTGAPGVFIALTRNNVIIPLGIV